MAASTHENRLSLALASVLLPVALAAGCANPADDVPAAAVSEAVETVDSAPAAGEAGSQTFAVADGSTLGFIGSKVTGSHEGGFNSFDATITVVEGVPEKSTVEIEIDTTSMWSDDEKLTGHLKSPDFFGVETYPTASFVSTSIEAAHVGYIVTGNLTLHGVTKSITFPAMISVDGDSASARSEFSIMRFDFGLVYPGRADDLIRDEVVIKFDIKAEPTTGGDA